MFGNGEEEREVQRSKLWNGGLKIGRILVFSSLSETIGGDGNVLSRDVSWFGGDEEGSVRINYVLRGGGEKRKGRKMDGFAAEGKQQTGKLALKLHDCSLFKNVHFSNAGSNLGYEYRTDISASAPAETSRIGDFGAPYQLLTFDL